MMSIDSGSVVRTFLELVEVSCGVTSWERAAEVEGGEAAKDPRRLS